MIFTIPVRLVSESNVREHWAVKAKRAKAQREAAFFAMRAALGRRRNVLLPAIVTITRIGVRELDSDNLARACKATRDGLADAMWIDDGDKRIEWRYEQRKGSVREYGVEVEIDGHGPEDAA